MEHRAIFLDRDGVLIEAPVESGKPKSINSVKGITIIAGVSEALNIFKQIRLIPIVITNQPEVSRGNLKVEVLQEIHRILKKKLEIEYFYTCLHDDKDQCECRKPKPGLILDAAHKLKIDLSKSYLVGDRWRDIEAGNAAKCSSFFIDYKEKS